MIVATYSKSYGNYVVIFPRQWQHHDFTAHMKRASKHLWGAYVNQGDVIGITGFHRQLHRVLISIFEVTENGVRVNPLSGHGAEPRMGYLTGYTLSASA